LSPSPLLQPAEPFRTAWRLNLPAPSPSPPPDVDAESHRSSAAHGESTVTAPMPGTVIRVEVAPGDAVSARQPLIVLEAMKMEIPVHSPFDGTVKAVHAAEGDQVAGGALLVELES
jgi:glutaconyl-CoA/methylmalonyl-CoA decarboxylase subunit gamma